MRLEWELDVDVFNLPPSGHGELGSSWHLKKVWDKDPMGDKFGNPLIGKWKISVAWVTKNGDRNYRVSFVKGDNDRTFRSLKAAKAYAVAIITLEQ
jgi:hypothetical protein